MKITNYTGEKKCFTSVEPLFDVHGSSVRLPGGIRHDTAYVAVCATHGWASKMKSLDSAFRARDAHVKSPTPKKFLGFIMDMNGEGGGIPSDPEFFTNEKKYDARWCELVSGACQRVHEDYGTQVASEELKDMLEGRTVEDCYGDDVFYMQGCDVEFRRWTT